MNVDIGLFKDLGFDAQSLGSRSDKAEGGPCRLLHDVPELSGQSELSLAPHQGRLGQQEFSADLGPGEA